MATAFQENAFQNDAFQIDGAAPDVTHTRNPLYGSMSHRRRTRRHCAIAWLNILGGLLQWHFHL